jgi:hypothetical protein
MGTPRLAAVLYSVAALIGCMPSSATSFDGASITLRGAGSDAGRFVGADGVAISPVAAVLDHVTGRRPIVHSQPRVVDADADDSLSRRLQNAGQAEQVPASFTNIAYMLGLLPSGTQPTSGTVVAPTFDPRTSEACYAARSLNQGLCGSDFAHSAATVMGINLCRAAYTYNSVVAPTRISPQYLLSLFRTATANGTICGGGRVGDQVLQPFVSLKAAMASRVHRAMPILSCNATADAIELCSGGCSPYVEGACTLDDPDMASERAAIPDVAVTQCPLAFSVSQCGNNAQGWLDPDSFALTSAASTLGATYVSVGLAAGMDVGTTSTDYVQWGPTDVTLLKAFLVNYGAVTVAMSACLNWQSWMAGCTYPPYAVDRRAGICLYREAYPGSVFNSTYGTYTIPVNDTLPRLPYAGRSCPIDSSLVTVTLVGYTVIDGEEVWIARGNWGTGFGDGGDFYLSTRRAGNGAGLSGSVGLRYPESIVFYSDAKLPSAVAQGSYPATLPVAYDASAAAGVQGVGYQPSRDAPLSGGYFDAQTTEPDLTGMLVRAGFNAVSETQGGAALVLARTTGAVCRVIAGGYYCGMALDVLDLSSQRITRWGVGVVKKVTISDALVAVTGLGSTAGVTVVSVLPVGPVTDLSAAAILGQMAVDPDAAGHSLYTNAEKSGLVAGVAIVGVLLVLLLLVAGVYGWHRWREISQERKMAAQRKLAMRAVQGGYRDHPSDEDEEAAAAAAAAEAGGGKAGSPKKKGRAKNLHANVAAVASETDAATLLRVEQELLNGGGGVGCLPFAAGSKGKAGRKGGKAAAGAAAAAVAETELTPTSAPASSEAPANSDLLGLGGAAAAAAVDGAASSGATDGEIGAATDLDAGRKAAAAAAAAAGSAAAAAGAPAAGAAALPGSAFDDDEDDGEADAGAADGADGDAEGSGGAGTGGGLLLLTQPSLTQMRVVGKGTVVYSSKQGGGGSSRRV